MQLKFALIAIGAAALLGSTIFLLAHKSKMVNSFPPVVVQAYKQWCNEYNKCPPNEDIDLQVARLNIFYGNYKTIETHNKKQSSFSMGINKFMDLTPEQFRMTYLGLQQKKHSKVHKVAHTTQRIRAAASVDWRTKGVVTPVKDQGQCGSCWAFSTTGSVESALALSTGSLVSLSEQQLVDCSGSEGNEGCNGGLMDNAFNYIIKNGITTEEAYPYVAVDQDCATSTGEYKITGFVDTDSQNDCTWLTNAVNLQPVSIAVDASSWSFYTGGIIEASDCTTSLDHGVLLVGYDSKEWLVKNSWGADWGNAGYVNLQVKQNTCGLCAEPSYPTA